MPLGAVTFTWGVKVMPIIEDFNVTEMNNNNKTIINMNILFFLE